MVVPGATEETPIVFPVTAPIVPATWVPCPFGSVLPPVLSAIASQPVRTLPVRSTWLPSTPVSITATVTPAPVDFAQASVARIVARSHCWLR